MRQSLPCLRGRPLRQLACTLLCALTACRAPEAARVGGLQATEIDPATGQRVPVPRMEVLATGWQVVAERQWLWRWPDWPAFGGWSDLKRLPGKDTFAVVSDQKLWMQVSGLADGGTAQAADTRVLDVSGDPESLALADCSTPPCPQWLGVEGVRTGCLVDASGKPAPAATHTVCAQDAIANAGPEAMLRAVDGSIWAIREKPARGSDVIRLDPATRAVRSWRYPYSQGYAVTAMAPLGADSALVLERLWRGDDQPHGSRLRLLALDANLPAGRPVAVQDIARWTGDQAKLEWDNFEGLELVAQGPGAWTAWLLTDDNMGRDGQHTLLLRVSLRYAAR